MPSKYFKCIVPGCGNNSKINPQEVFFQLPRTINILEKWARNMNLPDLVLKPESTRLHFKVCIMHFEDSCFQTPEKKKLNRRVVPTIFNLERVNEVKAKINALRFHFSNEMTKIKDKPNGSGKEDMYQRFFEFFNKLQILVDHDQALEEKFNITLLSSSAEETNKEAYSENSPLPTDESWDTTMENTDEEAEDCSQNYIQDFVSEPSTSHMAESPSIPEHKSAKRRKLESCTSDEFLENAGQVLERLTREDATIESEWCAFGRFIGQSIENMSTRKKQVQCRHKIMCILMECEEEDIE